MLLYNRARAAAALKHIRHREYEDASAQLGKDGVQAAAVGVRFVEMCNAVAVQYMSSSSSSSSSGGGGGGGGDRHLSRAQHVLHRAQVSLPNLYLIVTVLY